MQFCWFFYFINIFCASLRSLNTNIFVKNTWENFQKGRPSVKTWKILLRKCKKKLFNENWWEFFSPLFNLINSNWPLIQESQSDVKSNYTLCKRIFYLFSWREFLSLCYEKIKLLSKYINFYHVKCLEHKIIFFWSLILYSRKTFLCLKCFIKEKKLKYKENGEWKRMMSKYLLKNC